MLAQVLFARLAPLPNEIVIITVIGTALRKNVMFHSQVYQVAAGANAFVVHDVKLGNLERRGNLILLDGDACAIADDIGALLNGLDAAYILSHSGIELHGLATAGRFGVAEHYTYLLTQLVREDHAGVGGLHHADEFA